jgi:phage tail sheath protein FI
MPEYLAPGVFVEEVSFRSKSIEGVPTSTTGFAGMTHWGPMWYPNGPSNCAPRLITSYTEFERVYGGLECLRVGPANGNLTERLPYLAHAARVFFQNGGKRLYVSRVFTPRNAQGDWGVARYDVAVGAETATWRARWPGAAGNVTIRTRLTRSGNIAYTDNNGFGRQVRRASAGAVVEVIPAGQTLPSAAAAIADPARLRVVEVGVDGRQSFVDCAGATPPQCR